MPSITILEQDLTKGGGSSANKNIVYVPGFMSTSDWPVDKDKNLDISKAAKARTPILCDSIAVFERYFGTNPAKLSNGTVDKSYLYAKELIKLGLPVLYESMNGLSGDAITEASEDAIYATLEGDAYETLENLGEFEVKYLTSGGYANFQYDVTKEVAIAPETLTFTNDKITVTTSPFTEDGTKTFLCTEAGDTVKWTLDNVDYADASTATAIIIKTIPVGEEAAKEVVKITHTKDKKIPSASDKLELKRTSSTPAEGTTTYTYEATYTDYAGATKETVTEPSNAIATKMAATAVIRGDCIALIDHKNAPGQALTGTGSFYAAVNSWASSLDGNDSCAMFTPWVNISCSTYKPGTDRNINFEMPPSFAYLSALAKSIRTNASWLAVAGATRGQIPGLNGDKPLAIDNLLTNAIAENEYQNRGDKAECPVSINAITNIKPFGYRIWGNRTLKNNTTEKNLTATSFLNIRNMVCDIKKVVYEACRKYTFEQNNDVLWLNFKSYIEPTLTKMKTGAGLSSYKIIQEPVDEKAKLKATIQIFPLYAVEDFEISVVMSDEETTVS